MELETEVTATDVLRGRRSKRQFDSTQDAPESLASPDAKQIRKAARQRFAKACDAGIWKRLTATVLEPANPFDAKAVRRIRQEAVVLGCLLLLAFALAVSFNLSALAR